MCGGGGGGGDGGAAEREAQRQANVKKGYNEIQRIFDGFSRGVDPASDIQDDGTYYLSDGREATLGYQQVVNPEYQTYLDTPAHQRQQVYGGGYGQPSNVPSQYTNQRTLFSGGKAIGAYGSQNLFQNKEDVRGFDDDFYNSRQQEYIDYATPQLDQQYEDAVKALTFSLSRNGRLDSSTAADQRAGLLEDYNTQKTAIADKGLEYANNARSSVAGARSDLVALNSNLANPATIANEAQNRLSSLQQTPTFDTLAPLFVNVGEGLGTQADLERRSTAQYDTGLFNSSTSSGSGRIIK